MIILPWLRNHNAVLHHPTDDFGLVPIGHHVALFPSFLDRLYAGAVAKLDHFAIRSGSPIFEYFQHLLTVICIGYHPSVLFWGLIYVLGVCHRHTYRESTTVRTWQWSMLQSAP
jgi:hypothetical protein